MRTSNSRHGRVLVTRRSGGMNLLMKEHHVAKANVSAQWSWILATVVGLTLPVSAGGQTRLLNVSYDPTRELYKDFNAEFAKFWKSEHDRFAKVIQDAKIPTE